MLERKPYVTALSEVQKVNRQGIIRLIFEVTLGITFIAVLLLKASPWWLLLILSAYWASLTFLPKQLSVKIYEVTDRQSGFKAYYHVENGYFTEIGEREAEMYESTPAPQYRDYFYVSLEEWLKIRDG